MLIGKSVNKLEPISSLHMSIDITPASWAIEKEDDSDVTRLSHSFNAFVMCVVPTDVQRILATASAPN